MTRSLLTLVLALMTLFSNVSGVFNRTPQPLDGGVRVRYGDKRAQMMDVFLPDDTSGTPDVALFIHGGSWVFGDQINFDNYAAIAAHKGYIGVSVDYRKIGSAVTCDDMVDDVAAAVGKTSEYLSELGIETDKMVVVGHSSGAHLALCYSYGHHNDSTIPIGLVIAAAPPVDFTIPSEKNAALYRSGYYCLSLLTHESVTEANYADKKQSIDSVLPLSMVDPSVPATLLFHGGEDNIVGIENSEALLDALKSCSVPCDLKVYEGSDHFFSVDRDDTIADMISVASPWAEQYL